MLVSIPPKYSVSQIMGYLKGKSSLIIFDRHANLKYKYGNRHFWARGYFQYIIVCTKNAPFVSNKSLPLQRNAVGKPFRCPFRG